MRAFRVTQGICTWAVVASAGRRCAEVLGRATKPYDSLNKHTDPAPMVPGVCPEETVPDKFARNYGARRFITALPVTTKLWKGFI